MGTTTPPIHIALLRAINVGQKQVGMSDLRSLLTGLGFAGVETLLRSGNVVFRGDAPRGAELERLLEVGAEKRLGLRTDFFTRTPEELKAIVARNPFPREATRDPAHLVVAFLKDAVSSKQVKALQDAITGPEVVRGDGKHAYIIYPDGIGRSRLTITLIEKKLGTRVTARNWNTVRKLDALAK